MTYPTVSIAVNDVPEIDAALVRAEKAALRGAKMVEWRVDGLAVHAPDALKAVSQLVAGPLPCIVTCRPTWEGGAYDGDEAARVELLRLVLEIDKPPRYVDIELKTWREHDSLRSAAADSAAGGASVILSSHDFERRPTDLLQRVEEMTLVEEAAVVKIAWTARSLRDNLEAFDLLSSRRKPMIALCMGMFGLPSRVLAKKFGGLLTFCSDSEESGTAPGQPTIDELFDIYRFDAIEKDTNVYGVIGWPIEHSQSPVIHNGWFTTHDIDAVYLPLPIPPEWEHFKATVGALAEHDGLDFAGASVTLPHKEHLVRFVEERSGEIDAFTTRIGAANTLTVAVDGSIRAGNTDAPAVVESLRSVLDDDEALAGKRALVLGAGGVARGVVAALVGEKAEVTILNRTAERAEALAAEIHADHGRADDVLGRRFDIIINATAVGMFGGPAPERSPLDVLLGEDSSDRIAIDERTIVFDTVYAPVRTAMIEAAKARARVVTGDVMFRRQAARQFQEWTGVDLA